jgi:PTH1 family peptidyl-tRNA hydrolase
VWIVVGLGNPGKEYEKTRHNIGFLAVEEIGKRLEAPFKRSGNYYSSRGFIGDEKIILVKPLTFMNLSGGAVVRVLKFHECDSDRLIVIHDDLDMDAGRLKIKKGGGAGGHKGIESIIGTVGRDFLRIKIGIGRPGQNSAERYVLGKIGKNEWESIHPAILRAADAVEMIVLSGYKKAMTAFNAEL